MGAAKRLFLKMISGFVVAASVGTLVTAETPDYFHFVKSGSSSNFDSQDEVVDGVTLFKWKGTETGISDMMTGVCAHNVLEWDVGVHTAYPAVIQWHTYDMIYFVAAGNVTVSVEGESKTMKSGDTLWVQAGVSHSGFSPVDNQVGTIVDILKVPFEPQITEAPASVNVKSGQHRFYMASEDLVPPTVFHGPNDHYEWWGSGVEPDVLHVWWPQNSKMPCHSHAEGALYVTAAGSMCFEGERVGCVMAGDARWTKPGYQYSNEAAGAGGSEIIVLNIKSNPSMCRALV